MNSNVYINCVFEKRKSHPCWLLSFCKLWIVTENCALIPFAYMCRLLPRYCHSSKIGLFRGSSNWRTIYILVRVRYLLPLHNENITFFLLLLWRSLQITKTLGHLNKNMVTKYKLIYYVLKTECIFVNLICTSKNYTNIRYILESGRLCYVFYSEFDTSELRSNPLQKNAGNTACDCVGFDFQLKSLLS